MRTKQVVTGLIVGESGGLLQRKMGKHILSNGNMSHLLGVGEID